MPAIALGGRTRPHAVRLMPASDLSGHHDGPDRTALPSNRFAKPVGGVPIAPVRAGHPVPRVRRLRPGVPPLNGRLH